MSHSNRYHVKVDWPTVAPHGDTLTVNTKGGFDDRWTKAFEVVLDEHQRRVTDRQWAKIEFQSASGEQPVEFVLSVQKILPGARSLDLRRTLDDLVSAANAVAQVGTHVYELARELREQHEPQAARPERSTPPPAVGPAEERLRADAA